MTRKMGMDIDEYSERSNALGKGINRLCDDLYAATEEEEDVSLEEVNELLSAGAKKVELYEKLVADTTAGMQEGLITQYEDYIEDIVKYSAQLKNKCYD